MKTFPEEITAAVLEKHAHRSDAEVERDLAETEAEIKAFDLLADGLEAVANLSTEPDSTRSLNSLRASAHREASRRRTRRLARASRSPRPRQPPR